MFRTMTALMAVVIGSPSPVRGGFDRLRRHDVSFG